MGKKLSFEDKTEKKKLYKTKWRTNSEFIKLSLLQAR